MDNFFVDHFQYELHVYTGSCRNAGTRSNVYFRIFGTNYDTGIRKMDDGTRQVGLQYLSCEIDWKFAQVFIQ